MYTYFLKYPIRSIPYSHNAGVIGKNISEKLSRGSVSHASGYADHCYVMTSI